MSRFATMLGLLLASTTVTQGQSVPPRVVQANRFLAARGWGSAHAGAAKIPPRAANLRPRPETTSTAAWQPLGPNAVVSANYGLVTGRVSSIAFDPADSTGNRVFLGTTGGGVWLSQNSGAASTSNVVFSPLTDAPAALIGAHEPSISIGAITVQPGGTGVILAGTGDPNDALDSYYGAGILRSADGGASWSLIQATGDQLYAFLGEGFSGFAWSTIDPQIVVAAVSQAFEGAVSNAEVSGVSFEGLYYSNDSGQTWSLARITDSSGADVQGPGDVFALPHGNAATSVAWNPVRRLFVAAVRYHGYYQSADGVTWTRLATQPGAGLSTAMCPTNPSSIGSVACPIFRGTLAVNPVTGDTFAWTVDAENQDQGIWQDPCAISAGVCTNPTVNFSIKWNTAAMETGTGLGSATIANGDYNLALAAVPSGQDTLLLAGANDLWKCSLAMGCVWRNTTNANTCMSAQVAGYQHALAWNSTNPLEILVGNDSGLWRSIDAIGETGSTCDANDATHFQNLNGSLGSLAEVVSMSPVMTSPYTMMTGLGANGTAGVKSTTGPTALWPQILGGEGGPVAIDPTNAANWYVNNQAGVSIHLCSQSGDCAPSDFGVMPLVTDADVNGDGYTMASPAPFLVDPLDATQLLVVTCRVWRGPADGMGWSGANAISPFLDGVTGQPYCNGDALVRSIAAMPVAGGGEVIYVGMYGAIDGGANRSGHVFSSTLDAASGTWSAWRDLTLNPVSNDSLGMNAYGLDISSIFIDLHDPTGNTVYVTVDGVSDESQPVQVVYRSTDGGANWASVTSNLPFSTANSLVVDPQDANTAYIATDAGVFSTRQIAACSAKGSYCWSGYGTGLPDAPVVGLSAAAPTASPSVLAAATYGRGVWQIPLLTAGTQLTTANAAPALLTFEVQAKGTSSSTQTVALTNTGGIALTPTAIAVSGDFSETDNCRNATVNTGAGCAIQVTFTPTQTGTRTGQLTISANVAGGLLTVELSGDGTNAGTLSVAPASLSFGAIEVGKTSPSLQVTVENGSAGAVPVSSVQISGPFQLANNACGTSLAANSDCALAVTFTPTQTGSATGALALVVEGGSQTVQLSGAGASPPTDTLSPASLAFSSTIIGALSAAQTVTLTNSGGVPLTSITASASGPFQVSNSCGIQLPGNSSCSIVVVFAPTAAGTQNGKLTVTDWLQTQTVGLTGTGLSAPVIGVSPASFTFSPQQVGVGSAPLTFTLSNAGGAAMANLDFRMSGPEAGSFSTGGSTCGATLGSGSSCTAQVIFTPTTTGGNAATLTVSSATPGVRAVAVALSGTGTAASGLNVSPAQMAFTVAALGQPSTAQTATISNTSGATASGVTLAVTAPFTLAQNSCGGSLAGGASCSAQVVFTPTTNGTAAGILTIGSSLNAASVILSGTGGQAGAVQIQPGSLSFPATGVGKASGAQTIAVANTGQVFLTDLALTVSNGFQIVTNTCTSGLAPGATCTAGVTFAPAVAGQQTGNLSVASAALAAGMQATLSGMGVDFAAAPSGSSSQTVASGQTASYTLSLTPMGGSTGTFTFQCGSLPANTLCTFNPAGETVAANSTGTVTVQIATGHSSTSARSTGRAGWAAVPLVCGFVLFPLACGRRRRSFLWAVLAILLVSGLSSCSGSGGGTGGAPPTGTGNATTPAGTYSVPVAVTLNGVSHSVTLSLTVD